MSQYEVVVRTEYKYLVDANNEHEAINIYMNDHDSCIPANQGEYLNITAEKLRTNNSMAYNGQ